LIVDKVPLGAFGELEPGLRRLRARGRARCVLGLREVLDAPATVQHEWRAGGYDAAIRRYYDAVWVYGDPRVYDPALEYGFSREVVARLTHTGYIDPAAGVAPDHQASARLLEPMGLPARCRIALCCVGGGQDGQAVADAFARAPLPEDLAAIILTGPFMPEEAQRRLEAHAALNPRLHVLKFVDDPTPLLRRADYIVAMGGYNTVCEVLAFEKRALIVPRVRPRREQLIRAERMRDQGLIDLLHPDALSPAAIGDWLASASAEPVSIRERVDLDGLARLPGLLDRLCGATWTTQEASYVAG
jgi:predicted glycosyltransferase